MEPLELLVLVVLAVAGTLVEVARELLAGSDTPFGLLEVICVLEEARLENDKDPGMEVPLGTVEIATTVLAVLEKLDEC